MPIWSLILGPLVGLANGLGILKDARKYFLPEYQEAANQLAKALDELEKNYKVIDEEFRRFASLSFSKEKTKEDNLKLLEQFEPDLVKARMKEADTNCAKIENIYQQHLRAPIQQLVKEEGLRREVEILFIQMYGVDGVMDTAISDISNVYAKQLQKLKALIKANEIDEANSYVKQVSEEAAPQRNEIKQAIVDLRDLQNQYVKKAKTT